MSTEIPTMLVEKTKNNTQFDQFFILGAHPFHGPCEEPNFLAFFPPTGFNRSNEELRKLKEFCYPKGFNEAQRNPKNKSILQSEFVFYLTNNNSERTYGICVHVYLDDPNTSAFFCTQDNRSYPFCFCFLASTPFLSSHFQFLSYLALVICGRVESTHLKGVESKPPFEIQGDCLDGLKINSNQTIAVIEGIESPPILSEELIFYYKLPTHQTNVYQRPIHLADEIDLCLPLHKDINPLAYPTLHALFSCLSPTIIVQLYNAILLEQHILIVSNDVHKLSLSVIAITQLLDPFQTQALLIPVFPDNESLDQILETPVPYIIGAFKTSATPDVIVNLDKGTIQLPSEFPMFPKYKELISSLEEILSKYSKSILVPKKHIRPLLGLLTKKKNPEYQSFIDNMSVYVFPSIYTKNISMKYVFTTFIVDDIIRLFKNFFPPVLDDLVKCCFVTDNTTYTGDYYKPVTVLNMELLNSTVPEEDQEFYSLFFPTQLFDTFCNSLTDKYSQEKLQGIVADDAQQQQQA
ncbi:uDENN domain containing protein [Histomonas meleagridis]|nr:uDENN domain containing protein [Histomonas meleagridis]